MYAVPEHVSVSKKTGSKNSRNSGDILLLREKDSKMENLRKVFGVMASVVSVVMTAVVLITHLMDSGKMQGKFHRLGEIRMHPILRALRPSNGQYIFNKDMPEGLLF